MGFFKSVLRVAGAVFTVARFIPGPWSAIVNVLGATVSSALFAMAASSTLGYVQRKLYGPKINSSQLSRLSPSLDPATARKMVFGSTALNNDVRYVEPSGTSQEYIDYIIATSAHEIESIDQILFDGRIVWTATLGVDIDYTNYLWVDIRTVGTSSNYISINGGSKWGSSCRLTGCSYIHLRMRRTGVDSKATSPLPDGIPSRVTIIGNGAKLYDPRLDSTVVGGSGAMRATDQTTWGTANSTNRNNTALQLLWYLLGWKINGKLSVGCGIPPERIVLASFIAAANVCDEAVALLAGGTQPRYQTAGVCSDADDRMSVIQTFLTSMNATLRDSSGRSSLICMTNDLASPVLSFSDSDILGDFTWDQTRGLSDSLNAIHGRYTDASANGQYQLVEYPTISLTSVDAIERMETLDLPFVQDGKRAQRIAKQALQRAQYKGIFSATFTLKALGCQVGDVVTLTFSSLGWSNKLFRVVSQGISALGQVPLTLIEENAAIYAWDKDEKAVVTPTAPTIYDPLNNPLVLAIGDLGSAKFVNLNVERLAFTFDGAGALSPSTQSSTITATTANLVNGNPLFTYSDNLGTSSSTLAALMTVISALQITVPSTVFTGTPTRTWLKVVATGQGAESSYFSSATLVKVTNGASGTNGVSAVSGYLTKEAIQVFAYADGTVASYSGASGSFKVFSGTTDISTNFTLSTVSNPQSLGVTYSAQTYTITSGFDTTEDTASLTIRATGSGSYSGVSLDKVVSLSKAKGGYEIVTVLPTTNLFEGRVVFLTTDDKLYRYTGTAWTAAVSSTDITGTLADAQIAAVSATKVTGQITSTQITDGAISTPKLAAGAVTASTIAAGTIQASNIAAGTITGDRIASNTIVAGNVATDAITADKIQAGSITAAKLAATNVITLSAQIGDAVITNAKIGNLEVDSAKIANLTVGTQKITDNAVSVQSYVYDSSILISIPNTSYVTVQTLTWTADGGDILVFCAAATQGVINQRCNWRVMRNGSLLNIASYISGGQTTIVFVDTPAAGSVTYNFDMAGSSAGSIQAYNRFINITRLKK